MVGRGVKSTRQQDPGQRDSGAARHWRGLQQGLLGLIAVALAWYLLAGPLAPVARPAAAGDVTWQAHIEPIVWQLDPEHDLAGFTSTLRLVYAGPGTARDVLVEVRYPDEAWQGTDLIAKPDWAPFLGGQRVDLAAGVPLELVWGLRTDPVERARLSAQLTATRFRVSWTGPTGRQRLEFRYDEIIAADTL